MFKVGEKIVYPFHGIGEVKSIEKKEFKEELVPYYIIRIDTTGMVVMMPVENAEKLGIRKIVDKKTVMKALEVIDDEKTMKPSDWKVRYQNYLELLKSGSIIDTAQVVKNLFFRSLIKELPLMEKKLYENAVKLLVDEAALALNENPDLVKKKLLQKLKANVTEEEQVNNLQN